MNAPPVCILAAGLGARLGALTSTLSKALLPVGNQAVISHLIRKAPPESLIVVATGFDGARVEDYCRTAHPERDFQFIPVHPYTGSGSGPGYSLGCCRSLLQQPFYLFNCDTLFTEDLPKLYPTQSWIGIAKTDNPAQFDTIARASDGTVIDWRFKAPNGFPYAYIGIAGIGNYTEFWDNLDSSLQTDESSYVVGFAGGCGTRVLTWYDTGSISGYEASLRKYVGCVLGMTKSIDEVTYRIDQRVLKLSSSEKSSLRRQRAQTLAGLVPRLDTRGEYAISYGWIPGKTLYQEYRLSEHLRFLDWCESHLWGSPLPAGEEFYHDCAQFYQKKTRERVARYQELSPSEPLTINGEVYPTAEELLNRIDWKTLINQSLPSRFHGDLQFDNVVKDLDGRFWLLDWREEFGVSTRIGDRYYDLAKLYAGMQISLDDMKRGFFTCQRQQLQVDWDYTTSFTLGHIKCQFRDWAQKHGYSLPRIRLLAALVHLNMAPLHPGDLGDFLYARGIQELTEELTLQKK